MTLVPASRSSGTQSMAVPWGTPVKTISQRSAALFGAECFEVQRINALRMRMNQVTGFPASFLEVTQTTLASG